MWNTLKNFFSPLLYSNYLNYDASCVIIIIRIITQENELEFTTQKCHNYNAFKVTHIGSPKKFPPTSD